MRRMEVPERRWSWRRSSRIAPWTVTSRGGGGAWARGGLRPRPRAPNPPPAPPPPPPPHLLLRQAEQISAVEDDASGGYAARVGEQVEDAEAHAGLAGAALAGQGQGLPPPARKGGVVAGPHP